MNPHDALVIGAGTVMVAVCRHVNENGLVPVSDKVLGNGSRAVGSDFRGRGGSRHLTLRTEAAPPADRGCKIAVFA